MKYLFSIIFLYLITFVSYTFAQESQRIGEIGYTGCGTLNAFSDTAYQTAQKIPDSKIYLIYYEGVDKEIKIWNKKTKTYEIKYNLPKSGKALSLAKAIPLYIKTVYKIPKPPVIMVNGGFKEDIKIEVWIVPKDAILPKPTPTIDAKNVKIGKTHKFLSRDCARAYDMYN